MTTTENLQQHEEGLDVSALPFLFQDTIDIELSLGLTYIWIDALCIVQNDLQEWTHEARQMARIFNNTWITIAAPSAINPTMHMLKRRTRIVLDASDNTGELHIDAITSDWRDNASRLQDIILAPLNQRAW
jgi:hypothetical protein